MRTVVHHDYVPLLPSELPEPSYTLLLFRESQRVVRSSVVEKALAHLDRNEPVLAFGPTFTREAVSELDSAGIPVVMRRAEAFWTDESYENIKTSIGARVKRPPES